MQKFAIYKVANVYVQTYRKWESEIYEEEKHVCTKYTE